MNPRAFLVRGLLAGLLAGIATFGVAYVVGEPHVGAAIAFEDANSAHPDHADAAATAEVQEHEAGAAHEHSHGDEAVVSRQNQRTFGLLTGTVGIGVALGGVVALVSAAAVGRLGAMTVRQSTASVAAIGFVAFTLVPFLKYPATPPAVGNASTLGARTSEYFAYLLISVLTAFCAVVLARRLQRAGASATVAVLAGAGTYLVIVVLVGNVMPTVNEIGSFPADTLWYFRRASLMTLATTWATIGVALTVMLGALHDQDKARTARRDLAASL